MPEAVRSFGSLNIRAFGFACTGSSYLAGPALETELTAQTELSCGLPVVTAAQAIRRALDALGLRRVALVSPYPEALAAAGHRYWAACDVQIVAALRVDDRLQDTHRIYELSSADALEAMRRIDRGGADCVVASGTGMATLRALRTLRNEIGVPALSSNLCLAWALLREVAPELTPTTPAGLL
jgi:maleate isomerase